MRLAETIVKHYLKAEVRSWRTLAYLMLLAYTAALSAWEISVHLETCRSILDEAHVILNVVNSNVTLYYPLASVIAFFDLASKDREERALELVVAQPISKARLLLYMFTARYAVLALAAMAVYTATLGYVGIWAVAEPWRVETALALTLLFITFWAALTTLVSIVAANPRKSLAYSLALWTLASIPFFSQSIGYVASVAYMQIQGLELRDIYTIEYYVTVFQNLVPTMSYSNCIVSLFDFLPDGRFRYEGALQWLAGGEPAYSPAPNVILVCYLVNLTILFLGVATIKFDRWDF